MLSSFSDKLAKMSLPGNGIFVVQGEMAMLVTAMRRSTRWGSHSFPNEEYDVLMRTFQDLKTILSQVDDLRLLDPATYLGPFLEVVRSKETTGPVTSLALSAIHKFLSYGLIDPTHPSVPATVEDIADAVTHARFVGTDHSSDGVVLMKILQVLRTLMLSPEGTMLTDESVCEIMLSCFRICFETRLTELLRRNAEQCLRDMTQLIFMRLPQFPPEDASAAASFSTVGLSLKKREKSSKKKSLASVNSSHSLERKSSLTEPTSTSTAENESESDASKTDNIIRHSQDKNLINEAEITIEPVDSLKSPGKKHGRHSSMDLANGSASIAQLLEKCVSADAAGEGAAAGEGKEETTDDPQESDTVISSTEACTTPPEEHKEDVQDEEAFPEKEDISEIEGVPEREDIPEKEDKPAEYVNHRGIRFTPQEDAVQLQPYGLVCVRELFRFLISLCNPLDAQNTSGMVQLGLALLGAALELAADQLAARASLLRLVQDPLCRNLICLLSTERISIFALDLQVSFLLFEALRFHLKFQMEAFFKKIIEIVSADTTKAIYELKEIHHLALESLSQLFRIPGLCAELYLNYDCDVYCMNVFEELTKLLSKNVVSSTAYNIHSLSLEALLTVIEAIEMNGDHTEEGKSEIESRNGEEEREVKYDRGGHVCLELGGMDDVSVVSDLVTRGVSPYAGGGRPGRHKVISDLPSEAELDNIRNMKTWVSQGTELFNQKPERGVEYLQQHGVLAAPLDPHQVAAFLRENPDLDKKMIGEYICKRSSREEEGAEGAEGAGGAGGACVLGAFADSFEFAGLRIDQALRLYLETFRLPGEAPLIFLVMERFAERWHSTNGEPFANTDAAFRLAYAVIMLNMDQHNHNAKKLNVPMNVEDFVKNLRNCNGSGDFDQAMLEEIYHSIKNEEMVMPAERVGPVRDAYLWRVLQRRGATPAGRYRAAPHAPHASHASHAAHAQQQPHRARLLAVACPPTVAALSAAFERAAPPSGEQAPGSRPRDCPALLALGGLERCAALLARLPPPDCLTVDTLLLTLCKFTGLLAPHHANYIAIGVTLGQSSKAQLALRRACAAAGRHADCVRGAWRHILEIVNTLYIGQLLPKCMVEAEDYLAPSGTVSLIREAARGSEAGLFSSIYSYIALGETGLRAPTPHEKALIDAAADCVARCNLPGLLVAETKFLQLESLQELVRAMVAVGTPPDSESIQLNPQLEDITIFFMELLGQTLIQNRDRLGGVWEAAGAHAARVVRWAGARGPAPLTRAATALLRTAARLMRCDACAPQVLHHLTLLFTLPYEQFYQQADVISCGVYEIVKTSAQNVHSAREWDVVFALLAAAGAGAWPPDADQAAAAALSASSRSEGSEDESDKRPTSASSESELSHSPQTQGWILVKTESGSAEAGAGALEAARVSLRAHRASALARCCEALALVIRDVAHVTPYNCRAAVRAVRLLAQAALHDGKKSRKRREGRKSRPSSGRRRRDDSSDEEIDTLDQYHIVSIQLLDLMHTLHSRTAQIFKWWRDEADQGQSGEDYDLWEVAWQPLLQGIAQFCTDRRKQVSNSAIAYLQRALLVPGLAGLGGGGWEACFHQVLFPLLAALPRHALATSRANTIMCKVFLQHLSALSLRPTFGALWARVVGVQRALVAAPPDDPLTEAALESLKNMILVMDSVRIFSNGDSYNDLWYITWDKINEFLPNLKDELFPQVKDNANPPPSHMQPTLPTLIPVGSNSTPTIFPVPSPPHAQSPTNFQRPMHVQTSFPSPTLGQVPHSPVNIVQTPPLVSSAPTLVAPTPISGMVPIRNSLYDQPGLTSSVLLQPLNEMVSTPIGMSVQAQMPMLYPQVVDQRPPQPAAHTTTHDTSRDQPPRPPVSNDLIISDKIDQKELYSEYITNPYNQIKDVSKEATIYDPENPKSVERNSLLSLLDKKSYSANATPMHTVNKAQFGSSDNVRQESGMFNFSSYFGAGSEAVAPGSEVFDALMSAQEG